MIRIAQLKLAPGEPETALLPKICRKLKLRETDILSWKIVKKSIDARKKEEVFLVFQVDVAIKKKEETVVSRLKHADVRILKETAQPLLCIKGGLPEERMRPLIAGTGPAGLFCGYMLAAAGCRPILLERGGPVEEREAAVEKFWRTGILDPECNVQFGEGGAGTFSDGKLNTLVKDPEGRGRRVLALFAEMGAGEEILYEQKPHIGTDVLKQVLKNIRSRIEEMGGEFWFHTKVTGLETRDGRMRGVYVKKTGETLLLPGEFLVLAIGHSARDTFQMLFDRQLAMRAKSFAVGLRIEHPQEMIQLAQYGARFAPLLPPAPYKVTAKAGDGRGVYSFCMCPGGYVVNASSEPGMTAVNGMSNRRRDGRNANSAMIVTISPEDFGDGHPLSGVAFQRMLEKRAFLAGGGKVPVQLFGDFKEMRESTGYGDVLPDTRGGAVLSDLRGILPENLNRALIEGIEQCGRKIEGFDRYDAVLSGVESRTSSPVRIERDENLEGSIGGIYPCGEGAGYAGGITSAAMDGIRVAEAIIKRIDSGC